MKSISDRIGRLFHKEKPKKRFVLWIMPIGLLVVVASGYLVFTTPLLTPDADEILPQNQLLLFADIGKPDCSKLLAERAPQFCTRRSELLGTILGDYPQRLNSFADRIALAAYKNQSSSEQPYLLVSMLRITNSSKAEEYIRNKLIDENTTEEIRNGVRVFRSQAPRAQTVFFWRGWLVFSEESRLPEMAIDIKNGVSQPVAKSSEYQEARSLLPGSAETAIFIKAGLIPLVLPPQEQQMLNPLLESIQHIGITIEEATSGLTATSTVKNTLTRGKEEQKNETGLVTLLDAAPKQNRLLAAGIKDLRSEVEVALATIESVDPAFAFFVRGRARALLAEALGPDLSLENDILPLLENSSLLTIHTDSIPDSQKLENLLIVQSDDDDFVKTKYDKFLSSMRERAKEWSPRVLSHVLEDGTEIREVASCIDCITVETEAIGDGSIATISLARDAEIPETVRTAVLGQWNEFLVIASEKELAKAALQRLQSPETASKNSRQQEDYNEFISFTPEFLQYYFRDYNAELENFSEFHLTTNKADSYLKLKIEAEF